MNTSSSGEPFPLAWDWDALIEGVVRHINDLASDSRRLFESMAVSRFLGQHCGLV